MGLTLDLLDYDDQPTRIEVVIHRDTAAPHRDPRLVDSTDRDTLRVSMRYPFGGLSYDDTERAHPENDVRLHAIDKLSQPLTEPPLADLRSKL